jgi:hypothetical protein
MGIFSVIITLNPAEHVRLDRDRIVELGMRLGPVGAEDLISRTMEDLAVMLARIGRAYQAVDLAELARTAADIRQHAAHIGMTKLARVAADVEDLARGKDSATLAAVVDRLSRLGERSLMAVWDLQEHSL